jgi:hypothetical protein
MAITNEQGRPASPGAIGNGKTRFPTRSLDANDLLDAIKSSLDYGA